MSKTRCANTVPTSVAHAPLRPGIFRVRTATRANSPTLPGSKRVREQADGERREDERHAWARRVHRRMDHRRPGDRASDHREEVQQDRNDDPLPFARHGTRCRSPSRLPRLHQNRPASAARTTSPRKTRRMRLDGSRKKLGCARNPSGPLSSAARCVFVPHTIARSFVSRCRRSARSRRSRSTSSPIPRSSATWGGRRSRRSASRAPCSQARSRSSTSSPTARRRSWRARRARGDTTRPPG